MVAASSSVRQAGARGYCLGWILRLASLALIGYAVFALASIIG